MWCHWSVFQIRTCARCCNLRVLNESSCCHFAQRNNSGKQTHRVWPAHYAAISSWSGVITCRAGRRREEHQGGKHFPLRSQPVGSQMTFHRDTPSCSHSLVFFRTVGVESVKVLRRDKQRWRCGCVYVKIWSVVLVCFRYFRCCVYLMGWRGQVDCTGVGTAELGLINMAL